MQVVTPENHVEFIQNGKVAEFKPPEAKTDAKPADTTTTPTTGATDAKADVAKSNDTPRASDGKFVKAGEKPADGAKTDADVDVELTEKIQRIVNKKHREMREAQEFATGEGRRAIEAERRAEQLQREIDALKGTKSEGPKADEGDEPKQADFKTVGEYARALIKYEAKQAGETGKAQAEQSRQQEHANEIIGEFVKRQDAFKAATPDYEDVIGASDVYVPPLVQQYLVESDVGPQLAYHFAKNPDEVTRLKKLSPTRQIAELGKLEIKFEKPAPNKADAGKATEVSKAPAPISPLKGESATVTKDPSQMNFQELRAFREQERRAKAAR